MKFKFIIPGLLLCQLLLCLNCTVLKRRYQNGLCVMWPQKVKPPGEYVRPQGEVWLSHPTALTARAENALVIPQNQLAPPAVTAPVFSFPKEVPVVPTGQKSKSICRAVKNNFPTPLPDRHEEKKRLNTFALISFLCAVLIFPVAFAPIFGILALNQIKSHPGKYKGKWMAMVGIVAGGIAYLSVFVLLVVAIAQGS